MAWKGESAMSLSLWESHLDNPAVPLVLCHSNGVRRLLPTSRWCGPPTTGDETLLGRVIAPVLDVGCGPGRFAKALHRRGVECLGIDIAGSAIRLTQQDGAPAKRCSVFGDVPNPGSWGSVLLADGNVGIGGDPGRLLARIHELLRPGGRVLIELESAGRHDGSVERVSLQVGERCGEDFSWARLSLIGLLGLMTQTGFGLAAAWQSVESNGEARSFVDLRRLVPD